MSCLEGESLACLLTLIHREMDWARVADHNALSQPHKFWLKQQFAIGVNEVTRVLERMPPTSQIPAKPPSLHLQAVLLASDCNPRYLTKHLPGLASSRNVPVILVKDHNKGHASLRLGELVMLRTAIALGVKASARQTAINQLIEEILRGPADVHGELQLPPSA